jgi:hypothetical protein
MPPTPAPIAGRAGDRQLSRLVLVAVLAVAFAAGVAALAVNGPAPDGPGYAHDPSLPNPMGGPAIAAPGTVSGSLSFAGLEVDGVEVAMGRVPLGVTVVPAWELTNPTDEDVTVSTAQPQVVEGCCPGPVYADGVIVGPGEQVTVPARGRVTVEFPLQMHPGMDGPHHLQLPLLVGDEVGLLHVTGDFTAEA